MGRYVTIAADSFLIKSFLIDEGSDGKTHVTSAEVAFAEEWASDHIDEALGKTFPKLTDVPATPTLIKQIALLLASSFIRLMVLAGNAPNEDEHTDKMQAMGDGMLSSLVKGKIGIRLADGTFDPDFPGPTFLQVDDAPEESERRFFIQLNRTFEEMEHLNQIEAPETDVFTDSLYIEDGSRS